MRKLLTAGWLLGIVLTGCATGPAAQITVGPGAAQAPATDVPPPPVVTTIPFVPPTTLPSPGITLVPTPPATTPSTAATTADATTRPATTTTTRPSLSRAEATAGLCAAIESADRAVVSGDFVNGGLRLSRGIGAYANAADPAVAAPARQMLSAGVAGDADGYVAARSVAAAGCARAGFPIVVGGVPCSQQPCP